jgi:HPt (histidine-containing phosphotransfer) domain-containing protein
MARALRAEEARDGKPRTPVIALTAAALKGEAERAMAAGMDEFLAKPVSIPELVACLRRWLPHTVPLAGEMMAALPLPQASDDPTPLDGTVLALLTGGDPNEAKALMEDFLATTADDLQGLSGARSAGDLERLARQAHKIKGAARLVGAHPLAEAAAAAEAAAKSADWSEVLPRCADVETAVERLKRHVAEHY